MSPPGFSASAHRGVRRARRLVPQHPLLLAPVAGLSIAAGLPPWGWWPLTLVGAALFHRVTALPDTRSRFTAGLLVGVAWLGPGMAWMWFLTPPGYVIATVLFALLHGAAAALIPTTAQRIWSGPIAHTLIEFLRWSFPFGGVPLATLPIAMSSSPLLPTVRLGGMVLLCWVVLQLGAVLACAVTSPRRSVAPLGVTIAVILAALVAPSGSDTGESVDVATVQGGGEQGTTALEVPSIEVFNVHLEATRTIEGDDRLDLVTWPENGIAVPHGTGFADSELHDALTAEAARLGVPILVGITEDDDFSNHPNDNDSFVNAQLAIYPDGSLSNRYEKVRIVPFGEYVPLRGALTAIGVDLSLIGRDATPGQDPAQVRVELADDDELSVGVMISWEVFFGWRGRDAASNGAEVLLNPTNGSSYTWTILQTQQIASSRLRAAENGRWVIQDSPTGFSAFVSPDGTVYDRTDISEQAVIRRSIPRRTGTTVYHATGDVPWAAALAGVWLGLEIWRRRRAATTMPGPDATDRHATDRHATDRHVAT